MQMSAVWGVLTGMAMMAGPALIAAAVCWGVPRIRRSLTRWGLAWKTAPLGCLTMLVLTVLGTLLLVGLFKLSGLPISVLARVWTILAVAGGLWAAFGLQRRLLRRAGIDPKDPGRRNVAHTLAVMVILVSIHGMIFVAIFCPTSHVEDISFLKFIVFSHIQTADDPSI